MVWNHHISIAIAVDVDLKVNNTSIIERPVIVNKSFGKGDSMIIHTI